MFILEIFFLVMIVLSAIILTFFVMIQDESGEGMGGIFGGGSTTPFGSRAGNMLTRITSILAVIFFVSTFSYAFLKRTPTESADVLNKAKEKQYEKANAELWYIPKADAVDKPASDDSGSLLMESDSTATDSTSR